MSKSKSRLAIDPASKSTGWSLFQGKKYVASGTVAVVKSHTPRERIFEMYMRYANIQLPYLPDEVHIEYVRYPVHKTVIASVWAIGCAMLSLGVDYHEIYLDTLNPKTWQGHCGVKKNKRSEVTECGAKLSKYLNKVDSDDELEAIGMNIYLGDK